MARHGYLREYDEAPDRSGYPDDNWGDRNRGFMLDQDRSRDEDRDFPGRMSDKWRSSGNDRGQGHGRSRPDFSPRERGGPGGRGSWEGSPRNFSSSQDDHYLSWRDRQIRALDNDYADYCREREQQFHADFDSWRRNRQESSNEGATVGEAGELELTHERILAGEGNTPSPLGEATLGTNNSENTSRGRR